MNKKIKLSLLGTLIASSALAITLPIVSCSASSEETPIIVTADSDKLTDSSNIVTELLKDELAFGKTIQAQKNIVSEWKLNENLPQKYIDSIKEALNFTSSESKSVSGHDAIESIIFNSAASIPDSGTISGPELKVVLKKEYTSENDILIQVGDLGDVLNDIDYIVPASESFLNAAITTHLKNFIVQASDKNNGGSREAQQSILNSWVIGEEIGEFDNLLVNFDLAGPAVFSIGDVNIMTSDIVESLVYYSVPELPPTGEFIKSIQLKIIFKPEYAASKDFILTSSNLYESL